MAAKLQQEKGANVSASNLARNHWPEILAHFGIDERHLTGRNFPCPACGGKDRFRFDDKEGRGTFYCNRCGAGDGITLLMRVKGWSFQKAAAAVEQIVGIVPAAPTRKAHTQSDESAVRLCRRLWMEEARPVVEGDPVANYLRGRVGDTPIPSVIRYHSALTYAHGDAKVTKHPAMLAKVQGADGNGVALHRTYLTSAGRKANVPSPKKILGSLPPSSAVRLFEASECLGIAEGIETALAAFALFGVPTWAAISAGGLEKWLPPTGVKHVIVFGDNDLSCTGQAASLSLAKKLIASGIETKVRIPEQPGADWADCFLACQVQR